jgi:hypothetical protein
MGACEYHEGSDERRPVCAEGVERVGALLRVSAKVKQLPRPRRDDDPWATRGAGGGLS